MAAWLYFGRGRARADREDEARGERREIREFSRACARTSAGGIVLINAARRLCRLDHEGLIRLAQEQCTRIDSRVRAGCASSSRGAADCASPGCACGWVYIYARERERVASAHALRKVVLINYQRAGSAERMEM